jgi:hypothetical protein
MKTIKIDNLVRMAKREFERGGDPREIATNGKGAWPAEKRKGNFMAAVNGKQARES